MASSNPLHRVAIVGVYNTKQARVLEGETTDTILLKAALGAIADAGLTPKDIDGVATANGSGDLIHQLGNTPSWYGGHIGIASVTAAALAVGAGLATTAVVATGQAGAYTDRASTAPWTRPSNEFVECWGLFTAAEFALLAKRHMHLYGTKPEALADVAAIIRNNGHRNPEAIYYGRGPFTREDVLNSRMVTDPFHLLDICMTSEGGAGLVLTTIERARDLNVKPVYILGSSQEMQGAAYKQPPVWDKFGWSGQWGGKKVFEQAHLTPKDIDVGEFYDNFSFDIIRCLEVYGFCGLGEGSDYVLDGRIGPDGELPICTDGGLMSFSHPGSVPSLQRVIAGVKQIQGRAVNQAPNVRHVLVENFGSGALFTDQMILGAEPMESMSRGAVRRACARSSVRRRDELNRGSPA